MNCNRISLSLGARATGLLAAGLLALPAAHATNGYFSHGYGTKSKGMAGAGSALPQDAMAAAENPAGMAFAGQRIDVGASVFNPSRQYTVNGTPSGGEGTFGLTPGTVKSNHNDFAVPHFGGNWTVGKDSTAGLTIFGNGGMNTTYPEWAGGGAGTFYGGKAGVNLEQLFVEPTYARKINPAAAWGVSPIFAYQRFEARGLANFEGMAGDGDGDDMTNAGVDTATGYGLKLGVVGDARPGLTLAASYQTKVRMARFKKYSDLFANGGRFDVPATATVGLAYKLNPASVLALDIQEIWYSKVPSISNPFANLFDAMGGDPDCGLGGAKGAGFGWRDMTVVKLGYQQDLSPVWTVRGGLSYGRQPIPASEVLFNILAPGVQEWHYTAGITHRAGKASEFSVAVMFSPAKTVTGPNPMEAQQTISLKMHELEIESSWASRF